MERKKAVLRTENTEELEGACLRLGDTGYRVDRLLAEGASGRVWRATDEEDTHIALKVLKDSCSSDTVIQERFMREGRLLESLSHPNLLRGLSTGRCGRTPFIVMEYLDGETLRTLIDTNAPLPPKQALRITRDILLALDHLHSFARVSAHRDVKPGNIMVCGDKAVLIDLGIAKTTLVVEHELDTRFLGTPAYTSPEQLDDASRVDIRTDIYATGAILFEMLSGKRAFGQAKQSELFREKRLGTVVDATAAAKTMPDGAAARDLRNLLEDSMNPDYRERIQTTSEFLERVRVLITHLETCEKLEGAHHVSRRRRKRLRGHGGGFRKRALLAAAGALTCIVLAGGVIGMRGDGTPFIQDGMRQAPPHGQSIEVEKPMEP